MQQSSGAPSIQFLGAAGTVTGSKFVVHGRDSKVLIDCGMFQGLKELRLKNWEKLEVEPRDIGAVILTHAHLDHCGYLPRLVKDGFKGKIYLTPFTAELAKVILLDSAQIQTEDAKYAAKKGFSKHNPPKALYEVSDVWNALEKFEIVEFHQEQKINSEFSFTFSPSGHILGGAVVALTANDKKLVFSGDLGRNEHPVLESPEFVNVAGLDAIVIESTYGDREHLKPSSKFEEVINQTLSGGGSVLIPAFAVDRTEVILIRLRELMETGVIPKVPVYADSPMALKALHFYRQAIDENSSEIRDDIVSKWKDSDPFDAGTLVELPTVEDSMTINNPQVPCIIISASGMATGGRVLHHLKQMLPNPKHTVVLVGYQALGTRGRSMLDGAEFIKIHGALIKVKSRIEQIDEFSVHADSEELLDWLRHADPKPKQVFVVHGESGSAEVLADRIRAELKLNALVPAAGERFDI